MFAKSITIVILMLLATGCAKGVNGESVIGFQGSPSLFSESVKSDIIFDKTITLQESGHLFTIKFPSWRKFPMKQDGNFRIKHSVVGKYHDLSVIFMVGFFDEDWSEECKNFDEEEIKKGLENGNSNVDIIDLERFHFQKRCSLLFTNSGYHNFKGVKSEIRTRYFAVNFENKSIFLSVTPIQVHNSKLISNDNLITKIRDISFEFFQTLEID